MNSAMHRFTSTEYWTILFMLFFVYNNVAWCISSSERQHLKEQAKEMFYHAYHAYMNHAYPADELMPLSCKGRYRDIEPNRGDVDDALGNFSLTLVDTLDTLVILGDFDEFERAVTKVIKDVRFDSDVVVSVFETNIRMVGGLLSAHILSSQLQDTHGRMLWYRGELLNMARDLGYRLLPAFNTSTGMPHPRINLKYGLKSPKLGVVRETCTACAGTMILEFAALSRLTGERIFEEKARTAMDYLWQQRHRQTELMGTVLNIHNGDWIRRDSGVGAGIDSYYEYCLKAYILLGDDVYLERFNKHYNAIMKYIFHSPMLIDVQMHRPQSAARNFMDSLLAFWPGLQVLKGDIKPAIETHEMLYQVMQKHNFLPEAFTTDFQVHWGQHPLRPELVESTYFLFKATNDLHYLEVGKNILKSLQKYARVPCGFAAVKDVRTGSHEDRMDSFVLAETLKYLYLLFAHKEELNVEVDDFIFTTEAHLLPLSLARTSNASVSQTSKVRNIDVNASKEGSTLDFTHTCPNNQFLFPEDSNFALNIRTGVKGYVEKRCAGRTANGPRTLHASEFQSSNKDHIESVKKMGITVLKLTDGKIHMTHNVSLAESPERAQEGIMFMQELVELSRAPFYIEEHQTVYFYLPENPAKIIMRACPAKFGLNLRDVDPVENVLKVARPILACSPIQNPEEVKGFFAVVKRGDCQFVEKARHLEDAGAAGVIVVDNTPHTSIENSRLFSMDGNGKTDVSIPVVFLFSEEADLMLAAYKERPDIIVGMGDAAGVVEREANANRLSPEQFAPKKPKVAPTVPPEEEVEFVDSKPSPKSLESDDFVTPKKVGLSPQRRTELLLSKLQNLQQIRHELYQLLSEPKQDPRKMTSEKEFIEALEQIIHENRHKDRIREINQDVRLILSNLRDLVDLHHETGRKSCVLNGSPNPAVDRKAFVRFVSARKAESLLALAHDSDCMASRLQAMEKACHLSAATRTDTLSKLLKVNL